jgi:hypothetical protein
MGGLRRATSDSFRNLPSQQIDAGHSAQVSSRLGWNCGILFLSQRRNNISIEHTSKGRDFVGGMRSFDGGLKGNSFQSSDKVM